MSDGMNDARRQAEKIARVEIAAGVLKDELLFTGDLLFFKVHPRAVMYANERLAETGYQLVKIDRDA